MAIISWVHENVKVSEKKSMYPGFLPKIELLDDDNANIGVIRDVDSSITKVHNK